MKLKFRGEMIDTNKLPTTFVYRKTHPDLVYCRNCERALLVDCDEDVCPICCKEGQFVNIKQSIQI